MQRRKFFKSLAVGGLGVAFSPVIKAAPAVVSFNEDKPETNISLEFVIKIK